MITQQYGSTLLYYVVFISPLLRYSTPSRCAAPWAFRYRENPYCPSSGWGVWCPLHLHQWSRCPEQVSISKKLRCKIFQDIKYICTLNLSAVACLALGWIILVILLGPVASHVQKYQIVYQRYESPRESPLFNLPTRKLRFRRSSLSKEFSKVFFFTCLYEKCASFS